MLNEPNLNYNYTLGTLLRSAYDKMTPPPTLETAVKTGVPYTARAIDNNCQFHFETPFSFLTSSLYPFLFHLSRKRKEVLHSTKSVVQ